MECEKCGSTMQNGICASCGNEIDKSCLREVCEASSDFDADVKISLLSSCEIPAFKRYSGFSAVAKVYCGNSNLGVKIYVFNDDLKKAKEILNAPFDESELGGGED